MKKYKDFIITKESNIYKAQNISGWYISESETSLHKIKQSINNYYKEYPRAIGELVLSMEGSLSVVDHFKKLNLELPFTNKRRIQEELKLWGKYKQFYLNIINEMESKPLWDFNTTSKEVINVWLKKGNICYNNILLVKDL